MHSDLKKKFLRLEKNRAYYVNFVNQYYTSQLEFSEGDDKWNMLQLIDHLIKVESHTLQFIRNFDFSRKDEVLGIKAAFNKFLLHLALQSSIKFKVPAEVLIPEEKSKTLLLKEWEVLRSEYKDFLEAFPIQKIDNFIFFHPRSGKLNIVQTLGFLDDHLAHHRLQIKRISNSKHFPTSAEK